MSEVVSKRFYILNTNTAHDDQHHRVMLEKHKAIAAYNAKGGIEQLQKGDTVFLYRSGHGIVAVGTVSGKLERRSYQEDEEYSRQLAEFRYVSPPISAAEIKEITRKNWIFRPTIFGLDRESGKKLQATVEGRSSPE
ncbi:MAG: EVE domain-containing protein [Terriglobia bacterium]